MANKTPDYSKVMQDMMQMFPVDMSSMNDAFKTQATFADRMSKVVLEAAETSTEISAQWTKETLGKMGMMTNAKEEPGDYGKAFSQFASAQAEMSAETMAAFAEVAKKVQMETVELMLAAGKDMGEEASGAMKKATSEAAAATKKASGK